MDYLRNSYYCRIPQVSKALKLFVMESSDEKYLPMKDPPGIVFDGYEIGSIQTAYLKVLNVSAWTQRLRIVQPNRIYFHVSVTETHLQGKKLAPGESCRLVITFLSDSPVDARGTIVIQTQMCALEISLTAKNPFPWIEVPTHINLGPCLVGHCTAFLLSFTSRGAAAKFKLISNEKVISDGQSEVKQKLINLQNALLLLPFVAYPSHLYLKKDESGEIIINFSPVSAGDFESSFKIASEYGHEWSVLVSGCGINLHVTIEKLHDRDVTKVDTEEKLCFDCASILSSNVCKQLSLRNHMPISVRYYWVIDGEKREGGQVHGMDLESPFVASPLHGVLNAGTETLCTFRFAPKKPVSYSHCAHLYLDTRKAFPLQALACKHPKDFIKQYPLEGDPKLRPIKWHAVEDIDSEATLWLFSATDNAGCIFRLFSIRLCGTGLPLRVWLIPPVIHLLDATEQGQVHTSVILLKNDSAVDIDFSWKVPGSPTKLYKDLNHVSVFPVSGSVKPLDAVEVQVKIMAMVIGKLHEELICEIALGPCLPLRIEGFVLGPVVQISPCILDFGVMQVGKTSSLELMLTNTSLVPTTFKFLLASSLQSGVMSTFSGLDKGDKSVNRVSQQTEVYLENALMTKQVHVDVDQKRMEYLTFEPKEGTLFSKQQIIVKVTYNAFVPGQQRWAITCEIAGGNSITQNAIVHAQASILEVTIHPSRMDLGIVYLGLPLQKKVVVQNSSALQCHFKWYREMKKGSSILVGIQPEEGLLLPHGKAEVDLNLLPYETGFKTFIVNCGVTGLPNHLNLHIYLHVVDICCCYYIENPDDLIHQCSNEVALRSLYFESIDKSKIPTLDFGRNCALGCVHHLRVAVKNTTAIDGEIQVQVGKYGVEGVLSDKQIALLNSKQHDCILQSASLLKDLGKDCRHKFQSASGRALMSHRLWASACMQSKFGMIVVTTSEGMLLGWETWFCDVFCYSLMPGMYTDLIYISVGHLPAVALPLKIQFIGTPLTLREHHGELHDLNVTEERSCMVLRWNSSPAGHPTSSKSFWVMNKSPYPLQLEWQPMTSECAVRATINVQNTINVCVLFLGDPVKGPVKVHFEFEESVNIQVALEEVLMACSSTFPFQLEPYPQRLHMIGKVHFAMLVAYTNSIWFGSVLVGSSQSFPFTFTNVSDLTACWHLIQEPNKDCKTSAHETDKNVYKGQCAIEISKDARKKPFFQFDSCEGVISGCSQSESNKHTINVTFSPSESKLYRLEIFIKVINGKGFSMVLEGQGIQERLIEAPSEVPKQKLSTKTSKK